MNIYSDVTLARILFHSILKNKASKKLYYYNIYNIFYYKYNLDAV
jgi:hypothetical protein